MAGFIIFMPATTPTIPIIPGIPEIPDSKAACPFRNLKFIRKLASHKSFCLGNIGIHFGVIGTIGKVRRISKWAPQNFIY